MSCCDVTVIGKVWWGQTKRSDQIWEKNRVVRGADDWEENEDIGTVFCWLFSLFSSQEPLTRVIMLSRLHGQLVSR